jgi:Na+/H+ antiporter NhaD/arsenite permease-like protein
MLEKRGIRINLREYVKMSVPMTIAAVAAAQLLLHLLWM